MITTGLLAFGAGLLVSEVFDDDDDWDDYGPELLPRRRCTTAGGRTIRRRRYMLPAAVRQRAIYPAHNYNRPPNYQHGFNNNTIIVNNGGNDYWNRQEQLDQRPLAQGARARLPRQSRTVPSSTT